MRNLNGASLPFSLCGWCMCEPVSLATLAAAGKAALCQDGIVIIMHSDMVDGACAFVESQLSPCFW